MKNDSINSSGFTLIELVIVISLVVLISTVSVVNVMSFIQSQGTEDDIRSVVSELRAAYSKATGVFFPSNCLSGLTGYTLSMVQGKKDISVLAVGCPNAAEQKRGVLKSTNFTSSYTFTFTSPNGTLVMTNPAPPPPLEVTIQSDTDANIKKKVVVNSYGVFEIK
jgi:prepilin-type N-terminal cleavage/methylation domain-containing protein